MRACVRPAVAGFFALFIGLSFVLSGVQVAHAGEVPPSCDDLISYFSATLKGNVCMSCGLGSACYAHSDVAVTCKLGAQCSTNFLDTGDTVSLVNLVSLTAKPNAGIAYLLGGTPGNPVKVLIFGDSRLTPQPGRESHVFRMRSGNLGPVCERARSGMLLQTPNHQGGSVVVNGVNIQLQSTAYVVAGADLLFDQDPRIDRRRGQRNPNAPFCSGFDSDCAFGDKQCKETDRLVWGPFCRKDSYPYVAKGLYRVSLYGQGDVLAGATDYGLRQTYDTMGSQDLTLPDSYTFCWNGLQPGGTGFETIVQARSSDARVDHITLEYLGRDCSLPTAPAAAEQAPLGVMTVYNVEGAVQVQAAGQVRSLQPGQRVRIYFDGETPQDIDPVALPAPYVLRSPLIQSIQGQAASAPPAQAPPAPPAQAAPVSFRADETQIAKGSCTTLRWDVEGVRAVYMDGHGVAGHGSQAVCPEESRTYNLRVVMRDGSEQVNRVQIDVAQTAVSPAAGQPFLNVKPAAYMEGTEFHATADIELANNDTVEDVTFSIVDSRGQEVYGHSGWLPTAVNFLPGLFQYCLFVEKVGGIPGNYDCTTYNVYDRDLLWPNNAPVESGEFTLHVTARTQSGISAEADASFTMPFVYLYRGPKGYAACAIQGQRCIFSGARNVAFGADGSFNYKDGVVDGVECSTDEFGDPIPDALKACYIQDGDPPSPEYEWCTNENQWCSFDGTKDVAYGARGSFSYKKDVTDGVNCSNKEFGDPIRGSVKACYVRVHPLR